MSTEDIIVNIGRRALDKAARRRFLEICGLNPSAESDPIFRAAMEIERALRPKIAARSVARLRAPAIFDGGALVWDGARFYCADFPANGDCVCAFAYILTVGDFEAPYGGVFESCLADALGTAYAEAALCELKGILGGIAAKVLNEKGSDKKGLCASRVCGPGVSGMDIGELGGLFTLLDAQSIGVALTESGCMLPRKTLAGLIFFDEKDALSGLNKKSARACAGCASRGKNCAYCGARAYTRADGASD